MLELKGKMSSCRRELGSKLQEGILERMQVEHSVGTAQSCGAQHMGGLGTWNARSLARWKNGGWGRGKRL